MGAEPRRLEDAGLVRNDGRVFIALLTTQLDRQLFYSEVDPALLAQFPTALPGEVAAASLNVRAVVNELAIAPPSSSPWPSWPSRSAGA